ncbi:MAG: TatD family hydrolase [Muribaculaceae bacterium]|nr:TatD family hydrolase [Muribaculaceae bacterium]
MIPDITSFADIHTHGRTAPDAVTNLRPCEMPAGDYGTAWFSAGIHPWDTAEAVPEAYWLWLDNIVADARVVAVGECGLDALAGGTAAEQEVVFLRQADIARRAGKPLIIHCVRSWHRLLALRPKLPDGIRLIVHGFRGKPELARQLLDAGFDLSFGTRHNAASFAATPPDRRFRETDEDIKQID